MPPLLTLKAALCELREMFDSGEDEVRHQIRTKL